MQKHSNTSMCVTFVILSGFVFWGEHLIYTQILHSNTLNVNF